MRKASGVDIAEQIRTLLAQRFGVDPHAVTPEAPLRTLGVDSLALEELRLHIEDALDADLEDVELTPRNSVGQLLAAVCAAHAAGAMHTADAAHAVDIADASQVAAT